MKKATLKTVTLSLAIAFTSCCIATAQQQQLQLAGDNDAGLAEGSGMLQIGDYNSKNIVTDNNEIIARNNGVASELILNAEGSYVQIGTPGNVADAWTTGYTTMGPITTSPPIRTHYVTGVTASSGSTQLIAHGLPDQSKIIDAYVVAEQDLSGNTYYEHYIVNWHDQANVALTTDIGNNKNYKLFLIYIK